MDGDTMYEQYLRDCDELEKCSELKSNLKALVEKMTARQYKLVEGNFTAMDCERQAEVGLWKQEVLKLINRGE